VNGWLDRAQRGAERQGMDSHRRRVFSRSPNSPARSDAKLHRYIGARDGLEERWRSGGEGRAEYSVGNADDDRKHVIEGDQFAFVDSADDLAAFLARHGDDFIHHHL
jgi:hypothetical protein